VRLSVIISTYNSPRWLEKVLWGYSCQTHRDFEIIIADDGSTAETKALIDRMRGETGLTIKHVWQRDDGFRKCRILNKAILHVESEYVVFTDGDCIPRRDFLAVHAEEARPDHFLAGSYRRLPLITSEAISKEDILSGRCFRLDWLHAHGFPRSYKNLKLTASRTQARLLHKLTPARPNFKGGNSSAWLKDIMRVNGFDMRMAYGGEDREFGARLVNAGIKPRHVRYNAIVIHLDHARGYVDPAQVEANKTLREATEKFRTKRTEYGINLLLNDGKNIQPAFE